MDYPAPAPTRCALITGIAGQDGSPLASSDRARRDGVKVRVVEYEIDDPGRPDTEQRYRLPTTILDPDRAPAAELAPLYAQRWEFEGAVDELKVHQRGPRVVLYSKTPDGGIGPRPAHLSLDPPIQAQRRRIAA